MISKEGAQVTPPRILNDDGQATTLVENVNLAGASVWEGIIPQTARDTGAVRLSTRHPEQLNAILLFEGDFSPFVPEAAAEINTGTSTFSHSYTFNVPSVTEGEFNILYPVMDVTYGSTKLTTVAVTYNGQAPISQKFSQPNMNNGLTVISFPFDLEHQSGDPLIKDVPVTITLETDDPYVWSLGPHVCRPIYIQNTAYLCSEQAGCISASDSILPENFPPPGVFLPLILKQQ